MMEEEKVRDQDCDLRAALSGSVSRLRYGNARTGLI